jgi:hypothetical protein
VTISFGYILNYGCCNGTVVVLTCFVMCGCVYVCVGFCNVWVCVCVGFVMCVAFGSMCTCIYCVFQLFVLCFLYCFVYVYVFLLVLSVLPPSDNSNAVNNNNNNKITTRFIKLLLSDYCLHTKICIMRILIA